MGRRAHDLGPALGRLGRRAHESHEPERWDAWMAAHPDVVPAVLARARSIVVCRAGDARGNPRVSAKEITEWIRATYRVSINNSATAGLGEWLSEHEDLRPYVERRGKAAP